MKKILCMLTLITVCIIFVACQQTETTSCPTAVESTTPEESIEYTVYIQNEIMEEVFVESYIIKDNKFANADELKFTYGFTDGYIAEDVPNKTIEWLGETITMGYQCTQIEYLPGNKSVIVDSYKCITNGKTYLCSINRDNGKNEYGIIIPRDYPEEREITFDEAVEKSKEYMKTMYGDGDLSGYRVDTYIDESLGKCVVVVFRKETAGMLISSETLKFTFDFDGNMISAYTVGYGYMDDFFKEKLTEKRVKAAEEALLSVLPEDLYVQDDRYIEVDVNTGICYLKVYTEMGDLYINITD